MGQLALGQLVAAGTASAQTLPTALSYTVFAQWTAAGSQQPTGQGTFSGPLIPPVTVPVWVITPQVSTSNMLVQNPFPGSSAWFRCTFSGTVIGHLAGLGTGMIFAFFKTGGGSLLGPEIAVTTNGTEGRAVIMDELFLLNAGDALEVRVAPTTASAGDAITLFQGRLNVSLV